MVDVLVRQVRDTSLIMGIIALVGLLLQKKSSKDVINGVVKTVVGFMVFNIGSSAMSAVINTFMALFNAGFGINGVTTQVEIATALALDTYGTEVALTMVMGFVWNLIIAKFTKFKCIFLTGQHFLYFACVIALAFIAQGAPAWATIIIGGLILGFAGAALPSLAQPFVDKLTDNSGIAMGHFNLIGYTLAGCLGKLIGGKNGERKGKDVSELDLPGWLGLFRDFVFSVALFMVVLFYVAVIACAIRGGDAFELVKSSAGNDIWFIWPFMEGLQFAAGMSVLIYGVRQFIAEITAAFVGISEKWIPNSKPAVDCPAVFPFAPNAVIVGFVGAVLGGLIATAICIATHSETIMIPAAGICFFSGGTGGVFGSIYGGAKGAFFGGMLLGFLTTLLPLILYPAFASLGIAGASFPNVDYNVFGVAIYWILGLFH
ncbi:MAG: PTS ascorbate transporter subunit IIC [Bulleidia sp.]|nr:PTS ascorbate transporter subunit IIC [Bulleidia sp.]